MKTVDLYQFQKEGVRRIRDFDGRALLADEVGLGKAQPNDSLVLTSNSWVSIGNLRPGDFVIGSQGRPVKVLGVFPQGEKQVYEVLFTDGGSAECCEEHLWCVQTNNDRVLNTSRVLSLKEIKERLEKNPRVGFSIPLVLPVAFPSRNVPLDPYLLGYLLANGSLKNNSPTVSIPDTETKDRIEKLLPDGITLKHVQKFDYRMTKDFLGSKPNALTDILRVLCLKGLGSPEKFVPEDYLWNDSQVRLAILQGLMDGDGYAGKDGVVQFTSTSVKLAQQVRELVWSLGGLVRWSEKDTGYKKGGVWVPCRRAYTLTVALPPGTSAFRLTRKADRASVRSKYPPCRIIRSIHPTRKADCVCIKVESSDSLYVTNDYVVTHNTIQSLYYAWKFLPEDPPGPIVVVVPSHLKINWSREAFKHLGIRVEILSGQRRPPDKLPPIDPNQIYVVNYEVLVPPHWPARTAPTADSWTAFLAALKPRLLIADEAQYLRDSSSARTRAVRWLARRIPRVLLLTATPLANKPPSLWPLLNILQPGLFSSQYEFSQQYTFAKKYWWGWDFKGARNLGVLNQTLLQTLMIRRRKEDVLSELPQVTLSVVPMEVDLREYRRAEENFLDWLEERRPGMAASAAQAEQLSRMNHLKMLAGELKVDAVIRWVEDTLEDTGGKMLLGALHYSVTEPLIKGFGKRRSVLVDGRINHEEKQFRFDKFNNDPNCQILVGNVQAAGTGWSCKSTSDAALCEFPWTPGEVTQFVGRIHGIERGIPGTGAHVRFLAASGTIDDDLCNVLEQKSKWASEAVDGDPQEDCLDLHQQVLRQMRRRAGVGIP